MKWTKQWLLDLWPLNWITHCKVCFFVASVPYKNRRILGESTSSDGQMSDWKGKIAIFNIFCWKFLWFSAIKYSLIDTFDKKVNFILELQIQAYLTCCIKMVNFNMLNLSPVALEPKDRKLKHSKRRTQILKNWIIF